MITAGGKPLEERQKLDANGYCVRRLSNGDAIVSVRHDGCRDILVEGDDPQQAGDDAQMQYQGPWSIMDDPEAFGKRVRVACTDGAAASFSFEGNQVRLIGRADPQGGRADVYVDGAKQLVGIDCWCPQKRSQHVLYYKNGLSVGRHEIKVVARGTKNLLSGGAQVYVDAVQWSAAEGRSGFGEGEGPSETQRDTLAQAFMPGITLDEVNRAPSGWMPERNRTISVGAPERPDVVLPSDSALRTVFARVRALPLVAYVDSAANQPLVAHPPAPGKIVRTTTIADLGITEWTLSNGIRVLLKPTDFKNDQVLLSGRRPGGYSVLDDADHHVATLSDYVLGGAGDFSDNQLRRMLTGKVASAGVSVGENGEAAYGSASPRDLQTMFELFWLNATAPRLDTALFNAGRAMMKAEMQNSRNTPEQAFGDTADLVMANYNPRVRLFQPELLDSLDVARAFALYRQRFASFNGFTFYLVGNFTLDGIRPLVERYFGALPTHGPMEHFVDRHIRPPDGAVTRVVRKGTAPKAYQRIIFHGPFDYSWEHRLELDALQQLLDMRLRDALREDKGGTYGVGVSASGSWIPYRHYSVALSFGSAPERTEELAAAAFAVIDSVKRAGPTADEMAKIRETLLRSHETGLRENAAWIGWMSDHDEDGRDLHTIVQYPSLVQRLTVDQVRDAARRYLNLTQYARFTLLPEGAPKPAP